MRAISVRQPWASMIANGQKTIETRTWLTQYRGSLLIVASRRPRIEGLPAGQGLCICELLECRRMTKMDERAACCEIYAGACSWVLKSVCRIKPFEVQGKLGLYEVDDGLVQIVR